MKITVLTISCNVYSFYTYPFIELLKSLWFVGKGMGRGSSPLSYDSREVFGGSYGRIVDWERGSIGDRIETAVPNQNDKNLSVFTLYVVYGKTHTEESTL